MLSSPPISAKSGKPIQKLNYEKVTKPTLTISHDEMWYIIRHEVKSKYDYELPVSLSPLLFSYPTFRSLCKKVLNRLIYIDSNLGWNSISSERI